MLTSRFRIKTSSSIKTGNLFSPLASFIKSLNSNEPKSSKNSSTKSPKTPSKSNTPTKNKGHKSQNSNASEKLTKLTPYQGKMRAYGFFKCQECNRQWSSGYSWANKGQQCLTCEINVYPYRQRKLEPKKFKRGEIRKPHQIKLCEKCQDLGYPCTEYRPSKSEMVIYRERKTRLDFN
ncbi:unnamed protein product [Blepharisma stoltei]|uniref:3CxxC-type domain-containing protein n=1 Tax=Blepharisma stoltei TaxID=1481888 RepID=A0AAU9IK47_9CILI|nr:unnamed protein product [Blepharisma stoltei]